MFTLGNVGYVVGVYARLHLALMVRDVVWRHRAVLLFVVEPVHAVLLALAAKSGVAFLIERTLPDPARCFVAPVFQDVSGWGLPELMSHKPFLGLPLHQSPIAAGLRGERGFLSAPALTVAFGYIAHELRASSVGRRALGAANTARATLFYQFQGHYWLSDGVLREI